MFHVKQRRRKFPGMFHVKQAAGLFFKGLTWNIRGAGPQPRSMSISPMLSPRWTAMFIP